MTKAMILAAGRGNRMRPISDHTPKPLVEVDGKPLIAYHMDALLKADVTEVIINLAHLGDQIKTYTTKHYADKVKLVFSEEPEGGFQTGGGIFHALPYLGEEPFIVVNGDVKTDYPFEQLTKKPNVLAHLVLVDNPYHHPEGDFVLHDQQVKTIDTPNQNTLTFAGISMLHPNLFTNCQPGIFHLGPLLKQAANKNQVTGEHYQGQWLNVDTPERLAMLS